MEVINAPKRKRSVGLTILLVLVLIPVVAIVLAFLYLTCLGFAYTDSATALASEPMPISERFVFHADERVANVTVTEADLLWLFYAADGEQRLTELNETLATTPVRLARCGISIENDELAITAQCKAFGFLPLPIKAVTETAITQQSIDLAVKELYLGRWIKLPLDKLTGLFGIGSDGLQFSLSRDTYPLLERIDALSVEGDRLVAHCRLGPYLIEELFEDKRSTSEMAYYTPRAESLAIAAAKEAIDRGDNAYTGAAFDEILARLEADPAYLMTLRADVLGAAHEQPTAHYLSENELLHARLLPNLAAEVDAKRERNDIRFATRRDLAYALMLNIRDAFGESLLTQGKDGFFDSQTGEPAALSSFAKDASQYDGWFDFDAARIAYQSIDDMRIDDVPAYRDMPKQQGAARSDMQPARVYPVVLVMLGCDGTPLTLYVNGDFKLAYAMLPVREGLTTEENYRAFMAHDKVPLLTEGSWK